MKRRQRGSATPMSRRRHHSHLPHKVPTQNEWKELITDFQTLKLRNSGKVDRFHHMTDTITSENHSAINQEKLNNVRPQRLGHRFFWPRGVTILDKIKSPRKPAASTLKCKKRVDREREDKVTEHLVQLFQRKNGMKLFYLFDKDRKGYLSRNDLGNVLSEMGYNSLNHDNHRNIYQKLTTLSKGDSDRITFKDLRGIETDALYAHSLGMNKPVRVSHEDSLFRQYLDPIKSSKARHGELFFLQTDQERAQQIVDTLQSRYATLDRPLAKLKCWDINKDGRIERDEMKGMLSKMNIEMTDKELDEFFKIFDRNEAKFRSRGPRASYLRQRPNAENEENEAAEANTISYPIFLQTIMKHDFDDDPKEREGDRLLSPPQKKNKRQEIGDIDAESFRILTRLRSAAERRFKSGHLTTDVFRYLDANYDAFVNHDEFRNKLKHIDTEMTPNQANRIIALMDPDNAGMIKFGQFAQCFNVPDQEKVNYNMLRPHCRTQGRGQRAHSQRLDLFDTDPKSAMFASNEDRFNRSPFVPKGNSKGSPSKHSQRNQTKQSYNILHHS